MHARLKVTTVLDATDITQARAPAEFVTWMEHKINELSSTEEAKAFVRSGAPLAKKFYDELFPLYRFVPHEYGVRNDVLIQPNLGNENFDAHVKVGNGPARQDIFIEITYAKDGYDLSLRMEALAMQGVVPLTGPVAVSGPKGSSNRCVSATLMAIDYHDTLKNHLCLVEERLRGKSNKQYGNKHILVVAVDDSALYQESSWPRLTEMADSILPELSLDFSRVVFVGIAGRLFKSFNKVANGVWIGG